MNGGLRRIPSFSIILIMVTLCVVGAAMMPLLNVSYTPAREARSIAVSFNWPGASARVIEHEATSVIEGAMMRVSNSSSVNSVTRQGSARITVNFKKRTNMDAARFEMASNIRQIYSKLPDGVTYPSLSLSTSGTSESPVLSYRLNADMSSHAIKEYADNNILTRLSRIDGVSGVNFTGATDYEWVVSFDPDLSRELGITPREISTAFNNYYGDAVIGNILDGEDESSRTITIRASGEKGVDMESIPVKSVEGRIIRLGDIASVSYREALPSSYFRINGLNTLNVTIYAENGANVLTVTEAVKREMAAIEELLPEKFSVMMVSDVSDYLKGELNKIVFRAVMSFLILMIFVLATSKSFRYLFIIFTTIVANILIAMIFYRLLDIPIHLYSLAGITISLGLIIDTSIIMVDHYGYYRNMKAFLAILGALLTTIGSLAVIYFLPEAQRADLVDFAAVIVINLAVSIVVAFLFIPALLDKVPVKSGINRIHRRGMVRISRFTHYYGRFISWGRRHRWIFILSFILLFGVPIHMLPAKVDIKSGTKNKYWPELYNKTIGGRWYQDHKKYFEYTLGGTLRPFVKSTGYSGFGFREPTRKTLNINAAMPEGCTVHQLNEVMRSMENFLSRFDGIERFETSVNSFDNARTTVIFKPEVEGTAFPFELQNMVSAIADNFGGATWSVYGIAEHSFNNNVTTSYKSNRIRLTGYNYDMLYRYAEDLVDSLKRNVRVQDPGIYGDVRFAGNAVRNEFYIDYDDRAVVSRGVNLSGYYNFLSQQLYDNSLASIFHDGETERVRLVSSQRGAFDRWHVENELVDVSGNQVRLADIGSIEKRRSGNDIHKNNQEYQLYVAYDFVGPYELASRAANSNVDRLNEQLPVGYTAYNAGNGSSNASAGTQLALLLLIVAIIYFVCAVLFESLRQPLIILLNIPVGLIGVFTIFAIGNFPFDQGGYASFVLLCGLVVNAGIYIMNEYNILKKGMGSRLGGLEIYLKAYNRKIIPILLTVVSTILALIPFLFGGGDDVFWFSFALGVMSGMLFSLLAIVVYMPVFMPFKGK